LKKKPNIISKIDSAYKFHDIIRKNKKIDPLLFNFFKSKTIKFIFSIISQRKKAVILSIFLIFINSAMIGAVFFLLVKFINVYFNSTAKITINSSYLQNIEIQNFIFYLNKDLTFNLSILLSISILLMVLIEYISSIYIMKIQKYFSINLRSQFIKKINQRKNSFFKDQVLGDLTYISNTIITRLSSFILQFFSIIGSVIKLVSIFVLMLYKTVTLTVSFIFFAGFLIFIYKYFTKKMELTAFKLNAVSSENQGLFLEFLRIVKLLKRDKYQISNYSKKIINLSIEKEDLLITLRRLNIYLRTFIFLSSLFFLIIVIKNVNFFTNTNFMIDESFLITYFILALSSIYFLVKVIDVRNMVTSLIPQVELLRVFIFNNKDNEKPFKSHLNINNISKVSLYNISLRYKNNYAIKNVNIELKESNLYGLVGKSGSGKSTLLEILSLSNLEYSGKYKLNNKNIYEYSADQLKSKIGYLFQDPIITNDNLLNNLNFYSPYASRSEIYQSIKLSASDFIQENKLKFSSFLGESGAKLSGGEKQRIALARILLMNSDLLLFDEITSAIDSYNENIIIKNLIKIKDKKIIVMATHNQSLLKHFDNIIYMDSGKILNIAPHVELLKKFKSYKNLIESSSNDSVAD
jgi:ABC-type bacteriocin/lantibiotic exporter with double-glycine peptidase domain